MGKQTIYISGPMTGILDYNYPAFDAAEKWLGVLYPEAEIVNPAKNFKGQTGLPYRDYIRRSFEQVLESTDVYVLRGWLKSRGACAEVKMAELLDLNVIFEEVLRGELRGQC